MRPWTDDERSLLRALHLQNLSSTEIAERLGRTGEAVSNMSRRLGLRRRDTAQPWTAGQLRTLKRMLEDGCSLQQIADSTGHPRSSVADKLRRMNVKSQRFRHPWSDDERETVLRLHAAGATLAAIARVLPNRSIDAVQQKLQELVGPAPFRSGGRVDPTPPPSAAPKPAVEPRAIIVTASPPVLKPSIPELPAPRPAPIRTIPARRSAPPLCPLASADEMVRWLRSRDFMVLHLAQGWQVDRHVLDDETALLDFVNVRRLRLNLPPFITMSAAFQARPSETMALQAP